MLQLRKQGKRPAKKQAKIVIDTGVLVSAFAFGGTPEKAVRKAFTEADIFVSSALLKEYREVPLVLRSERKIDIRQFKALISGIAAFVAEARIVYPAKKTRLLSR